MHPPIVHRLRSWVGRKGGRLRRLRRVLVFLGGVRGVTRHKSRVANGGTGSYLSRLVLLASRTLCEQISLARPTIAGKMYQSSNGNLDLDGNRRRLLMNQGGI